MVRKQLDSRIPTLISNGVNSNHRSFFVLVGDKGKEQIVNLHYLLAQTRVTARPSVLWCYKNDLGFTSHRKKREAKIKRDVKRGIREANEQSPFELFVAVTDIRYTYYKDSPKILGQTFGMLVLQDFEAITPNLLARTIETVEGGGIVVLLLRTMSSLKQLYTMTMDVHSRYRTDSHNSVVARFNERFILSLSSCDDCLVLDDELNVLPISKGKDIVPLSDEKAGKGKGKSNAELLGLKESLEETKGVGELVKLAKTLDQAKAILTFVEAIAEKTLSSTVALTAGRGRGKSAALGLAITAALSHGYSNIFVTSPTPENLKTLFEFVFKGLDALGYEEHLDYDIVQSTNPDFNKAVVRVNVFKGHRQTIQYIQPEDAHTLGQAELVIIDEAAAIPLPLVKQLIGPYLVFMASTINGYEGTGRSLSIKLLQQLRESTTRSASELLKTKEESATVASSSKSVSKAAPTVKAGVSRTLREIKLEEPIRYGQGDKVEKWLNAVLCLDATVVSKNISGCPHPSQCELFYVSRDTLFSYHPASEVFLQRMMALYVASHYKNTPNDLQMMSDAPAHHLFVLLPPLKGDETTLPDPLVVVQVALEGNISKEIIMKSLAQGVRAQGDMIPWLVAQQFQDDDFAMLSGARIVRIATHPDYTKMGYGGRAVELLGAFYNGELSNLNDLPETNDDVFAPDNNVGEHADLLTDKVTIRDPQKMPPLLQRLSDRRPELLDYLGVSYGLTPNLLNFWKRSGFSPLYVGQRANDLTGEHSIVMLKTLGSSTAESENWLSAFSQDFRKRFLTLLSFKFREFSTLTALDIVESASSLSQVNEVVSIQDLNMLFTPFDLKRLASYANSQIDYHLILDLLPSLAALYFAKRLPKEADLPALLQRGVLLSLGLQRKPIEDVASELGLEVHQALAFLIKTIKKHSAQLDVLQRAAIAAELPERKVEVKRKVAPGSSSKEVGTSDWRPMETTVEQDLNEAGNEISKKMREVQREIIDSMDMSEFAINETEIDLTPAMAQVKANAEGQPGRKFSSIVTVKKSVPAPSTNEDLSSKRKSSDDSPSKEGDRHKKKNKKAKK